jgi:hypothetical protein
MCRSLPGGHKADKVKRFHIFLRQRGINTVRSEKPAMLGEWQIDWTNKKLEWVWKGKKKT